MIRYTQYTNSIRDYEIQYGKSPFIEYKEEQTSEQRKDEILDWLFNLMREKDELPTIEYEDSYIDRVIINLSDLDSHDIYKNRLYGLNPIGVNILNTFFPEIYHVSKGSGNAYPSIYEYFHNDHLLKRCLRKTLTFSNSEFDIIQWIKLAGAGFCSNFRPASAKALYEIYGKKENCKVFDSSAGYGSRLLGAMVSKNVSEYLGIDPNTADSCNRLRDFLTDRYRIDKKAEVLKMGSEDFTPEAFPQYQNYFDLYFTSPPYFDTERYADDETQSYKKFPTYAGWVQGFYQATIDNACSALKTDGVFAINIFEKVPNIKELTKLFLANNGWYVYQTDKYLLKTMPGNTHRKDENGEDIKIDVRRGNSEPIWYAKHYSQLLSEGIISKVQAKAFEIRAIKDTHKKEGGGK